MQRNRGWIWFFVVLGILAAAAVTINVLYSARQRLTMDQLRAAEDRWDQGGPRDYDLVIDKTIGSATPGGDKTRDRITVEVRGGKSRKGTINGQPLDERLLGQYDMTGWLSFVEEFVRQSEKPDAPRTFLSADFDPQTGALLRFRRSVRTTREWVEVVFRLTPVSRPALPRQ
jgi:hypothetical protein